MPLTIEPASSANANPSSNDSNLPIALRKGTRSFTDHPISIFVSYDSLHPCFRSFTLSISSEFVLRNHKETLLLHRWKAAMDEEIATLTVRGT